MRSCLKHSPPSNNFSSPISQADNTPTPSVQRSLTVNLSREYTRAIHTISYNEIQRIFYEEFSFDPSVSIVGHVDTIEGPQLLQKVLKPTRECIQEALSSVNPNSLTYLAATYFEHSEHTSRLYFLLYQTLHHARFLYTPIHKLLDDHLPIESVSDSYSLSPFQCELTLNAFLQFDLIENPFHSSDSHYFEEMRQCLSQLRQQLDHHIQESRSKLRLIRRCSMGSALCLITAVIGVVVSAVVIGTHALVALVAGPICPVMLPSSVIKKEMVHLAQLDAAAMGAYVVRNDLDTIDRLVARLHATVENDRVTIRLGLERGKDRYNIQEMLKQVRKNRPSFEQQLGGLEEHLFLCFDAINQARLLLLKEIHMHKNPV